MKVARSNIARSMTSPHSRVMNLPGATPLQDSVRLMASHSLNMRQFERAGLLELYRVMGRTIQRDTLPLSR